MDSKIFDLLINNSLSEGSQKFLITDTLTGSTGSSVYFNQEYKNALIEFLGPKYIIEKRGKYIGTLSKEFQASSKGNFSEKRVKICSIASSARLGLLFTSNSGGDYEIEQKLLIKDVDGKPISENTSANLDAEKNGTFYEFKCHEICGYHNSTQSKLSFKYASLLSAEYGIRRSSEIEKYVENDQTKYREIINLTIQDISGPYWETWKKDPRLIYQLHFDLKQLICHLFGISQSDRKNKKLQYVFFVPDGISNEENELLSVDQLTNQGELGELYKELNKEIDLIWNHSLIKDFCIKHHITLLLPKFVSISSPKMHDFIIERLEKKSI